MSKRDVTKRKIAEAFTQLVENEPLEKVSVALLVEEMGINRKTFYYHFNDKPDLMLWMFRTELAAVLREHFPESALVLPRPDSGDPYPDLPFYARVKSGVRSLDQSEFLKIFTKMLLEKRNYYLKLVNDSRAGFLHHLGRLYEPEVAMDIKFILGGRYMPDKTLLFLARTTTTSALSMINALLIRPDDDLLDDTFNPFWNILHEGLRHAIEEHPMSRPDERRREPGA